MNARKTDLLKQTASAAPRRLHLRDPQEAELPAYAGVGTDLRASRQRAQLDIAGLAGHLRIQPSYLEAIEEGRFADLPGTPYALGFVRSYAAFFDLDADELVRRFKEEASLTPPNRRLVFPEPVEQPQRPRAWLVVLCLVVAAAGFAGWRYLENRGRADIAAVTPPPERLANLVTEGDAPSSGAGTAPAVTVTDRAGEAVATATAAPAPADPSLTVATSASVSESASSPDREAGETFESTAGSVSASAATTDEAQARPAVPEMPALARAAVEVARLTTEAERASLQRRAAATQASTVATTPSPVPPAAELSPDGGAGAAHSHSDEARSDAGTVSATAGASVSPSTPAVPAPENEPASTAAVEADTTAAAPVRTAPLPANRDVERRRISTNAAATIAEPHDEAVVRDPAHDTVGQAPVPRTETPTGGEVERDIVVVDPPVRRRVGAAAAARQENAVAAIVPAAPERSTAADDVGGDDPAGDVGIAPRVARAEPVSPPTVADSGSDAAPSAPQLNAGRQPQVFGASNADARVVIRARADSWVQVQGDGNELLLTRMLRMGDTFRVPDRDDLVLMTGNAGAIDVIVDGRRLGPLGPNGQVRRNVPLTAEALSRIAASRGG